jgi:hypothetical protein
MTSLEDAADTPKKLKAYHELSRALGRKKKEPLQDAAQRMINRRGAVLGPAGVLLDGGAEPWRRMRRACEMLKDDRWGTKAGSKAKSYRDGYARGYKEGLVRSLGVDAEVDAEVARVDAEMARLMKKRSKSQRAVAEVEADVARLMKKRSKSLGVVAELDTEVARLMEKRSGCNCQWCADSSADRPAEGLCDG